MTYLLLIIVTLALGIGAQAGIKAAYRKWSQVYVSTGLTGAEAARRMLDDNGLYDVRIDMIAGAVEMTDNYDPTSRTLHLSQGVYSGRTVAATAIACHEAGHAVQHAVGYKPLTVRSSIVPVVSFASNIWLILLIVGIFMNLMGLIWAAVILYACVVVFQLVTLPVEFNASARALATIKSTMPLPAEQYEGCGKVLRAAAFTYVAAALASLLQLLYFLAMADRN